MSLLKTTPVKVSLINASPQAEQGGEMKYFFQINFKIGKFAHLCIQGEQYNEMPFKPSYTWTGPENTPGQLGMHKVWNWEIIWARYVYSLVG